MKGETEYDEALALLARLVKQLEFQGDPEDMEKATQMIAARQAYLDSHERICFYFVSSRGAKEHAIMQFPVGNEKIYLDDEIEEWAQGIMNNLPPSGSFCYWGYRKLEDGETVQYGDFDFNYVKDLPNP